MDGATPMIQQYRAIKEKHRDAILFFRLGDFYEMFFEDAELAARELEIVLTGRDGGKALGRVPMAGIPYHSAEGYVARLIEKGYKIAICEQVEDPKEARGIVRREVIRIITPGTLVEPRLLDEKRNNYLAAIVGGKEGFGLAAADASTGEFMATEIGGPEALRILQSELARLDPAECLLEPGLVGTSVAAFVRDHLRSTLTAYQASAFSHYSAYQQLTGHFGVTSLRGYGCEGLSLLIGAAGALLSYLEETQKTSLGQITGLSVYHPGAYMVLDQATRRNLELTRRIGDGSRRGTLLSVIDRTVTAMGGRTIRAWVERPLLRLDQILGRQSAVAELASETILRADLRDLMRSIYDLERLAGRVAHGSANARDLIALRLSLGVIPRIRELLWSSHAPRLSELAGLLDPLDDVRSLIEKAIEEDPPVSVTEGGIIRSGYSQEVDSLRLATREGKGWIAALEAREKERTGIKSLKVGFNKVFGYYIEVTSANLGLVPADYIRKQTLANAERFVTPDLKEKESLIVGAEDKLMALEYQLFTEIRGAVAEQTGRIQQTARAVAELDALASLAEVAVANRYVRPDMDESDIIEIKDGRHPVLEQVMGEGAFVPNDARLDCGENRLLVITGPNMGGKSTYMRQVALICLLAQMGSFVPAKSARLSIVDRVFTRVGASDDLATGQSTFMVEMTEVANILHGATSRSLIILDEIGRGTATFDGLSIAWAVAEYVHEKIGAKTMFATHYHEVCELEGLLGGARNYSVAVQEKGEDIVFLRRIVRGGADRSYGIQVARLAGLPRSVIERSREILLTLEQQEGERKARREVAAAKMRQKPPVQLSFFEQKPHPVVEQLLALNIMALTPLEALNELHRLQEKARERE